MAPPSRSRKIFCLSRTLAVCTRSPRQDRTWPRHRTTSSTTAPTRRAHHLRLHAQRNASPSKQAPRYASPCIPSREGIRAAKVRTARPAHPSPVRGPGIRFKTAIAEPRPARLRSQSPKSEDHDARSLLKSENVRRRRHRHRRQHFIDTVFQVGDQTADLLSGPWEAKRSRRFRTVGKVLDLSRTDLESSSSEPGFSIISTRVMENLNATTRGDSHGPW